MIVSLLAINKFLQTCNNLKFVFKDSYPSIPEMIKSIFLFLYLFKKFFKI